MSGHEEHACACGGNCSCQHDSAQEVYLTREEYISELEKYMERLHAEIKSVEEELTALRQPA
jgi:hypothetical protein